MRVTVTSAPVGTIGSGVAGDASTRQNPKSSAAATNMGAAGNRNCRRPTASVRASQPQQQHGDGRARRSLEPNRQTHAGNERCQGRLGE